MDGIRDIDHNEIEKRKDRVRRAWEYKKVDHIPIGFWIDDFSDFSLKELCENGELQYKENVKNIDRLLRLLPDDYIPAARVWPGYMTIATMFGLEPHWSDDPNQAPGINEHIIFDMSDVYKLKMPNAEKDGLMPFNLKWLDYFSKNLPADVALTGIDLGGPLNTAKDLIDTNLLYTSFYDSPEEYHYFLNLAADLQVNCYGQIISAVGSIDRMTCIDYDPMWGPEGRKGFVSDDVCATFSPEIFREFSIPYSNKIFQKWQGGRIHNCGPNPSIDLYLHHNPEINGLNCSYKYSKDDALKIKRAFSGKGIVEFAFDNGESVEEIIKGYEEMAVKLSPDVVAIPFLWLDDTWSDEAIIDVHHGLKKVSEKYSNEIRWTADL
jgi:uroporphyrinogen-III decarboxylase